MRSHTEPQVAESLGATHDRIHMAARGTVLALSHTTLSPKYLVYYKHDVYM